MTITNQQAIQHAASQLAASGIDTAKQDACVLLRHVLGIDRTQLFMRYPDPLSAEDAALFEALITHRFAGAPVAYLTGTREFMGLEFHVAPGVLIPRPDTEPLIEWALAWLSTRPNSRIADIGTGSGAIAISLAAHLSEDFSGQIMAIDTSSDALAIAQQNADSLLAHDRRLQLAFVKGSLTQPVEKLLDLLLANLPYLTPDQIAENPDLDAEPRLALDGGADGMDLIRDVILDLPRVLSADGAAGFEIDPSQEKPVSALLHQVFPGSTIHIVPDLARLSRHIVLTRS